MTTSIVTINNKTELTTTSKTTAPKNKNDRAARIKLLTAAINKHLTTTTSSRAKPMINLVIGEPVTMHVDLVEGPEAVMMQDPIDTSTPDVMPLLSIPVVGKAKTKLSTFVREKSQKFGINCSITYNKDAHAMFVSKIGPEFEITINPLYLLTDNELEVFLKEKPAHSDSIKKFLVSNKPGELDQAASDLVDWYNTNMMYSSLKVANNDTTKLLAKEILIMHGIGRLDHMKQFLLTHEMGHAYDDRGIVKSFGDFEPASLSFIEPHQYGEVRADLTAARELNAHVLGMMYFAFRNIIAGQPAATDPHPTDALRERALRVDYAKLRTI